MSEKILQEKIADQFSFTTDVFYSIAENYSDEIVLHRLQIKHLKHL